MNPGLWLLKKAKNELLVVFGIISFLLIMPIFTVAVITATGASAVSGVLAAVNPITHLVEIFDSRGNKVGELTLSTTWPTTGYISDEFGANGDFRNKLGYGAHTGIDIANERGVIGTPVTTFMTGVVNRVDNVNDSACGINVLVVHENNISSLYCHLSATATTPSTRVNPGDIIGYMGSTGASTGPHLHFQVMINRIPVNPRTFMVDQPAGTYASN